MSHFLPHDGSSEESRVIANASPVFEEALEQARAGATVVTASQRLARVLQERYDTLAHHQGQAAWEAPAILPWPAWIAELWRAALYSERGRTLPVSLAPQAARALWERVIVRSPESDALLQVSATAKAAAAAWELMHQWRLEASALEVRAMDDTLAFLGWSREFEAACEREGCIDPAGLPDVLSGLLTALELPPIALAGFEEFTPQQHDFLDAYRRAGGEVRMAAPPVLSEPGRAVRAAFACADDEIAAAARWARALLEQGAASVAVVMPRLKEFRPKVARIFSEVLDPGAALPGASRRRTVFNISASPALASYPIVHAALAALELDPARNGLDLVSRTLRSPFLTGGVEEWSVRASLDARLRRMGSMEVSIARVERLCAPYECPLLARALAAWRRERDAVPARQRPSEWARTFDVLLAALGWPGGRELSSEEFQAVHAWSEMLSEFAALEIVLESLTYSEALGRLARMVRERLFQPETGAAPVQILGALETPGLAFEHLWIAGLDDESWPSAARPAAFLPAAVQRERGLPHASAERELAFTRALTARLLRSAPDIVVSHALRDGDRELAASPLIRDIPEGEPGTPSYPLYRDVVRDSSRIEEVEDHAAPPVGDGPAAGGTRVFKYQAMCPFRAFAELRLNAEPLETPAPGLSPMERGILVHDALEALWRELGSHRQLCEASAEALRDLIRRSIFGAMTALGARRGDALPERFASLEAARLAGILVEWLELEKQRRPFTVVETEAERQAAAGGVLCKVKVDRVDRLEDGRHVIIDYKTGAANLRSWIGERPDEPQLPLYAVTHESPLAGVLFGQLKTGEIGFKGYAAAEDVAPGAEVRELPAELAEWQRVLDRLGSDFRAGVADVNPKDPNACRRCTLLPLCRFGDVETPTSAFNGNGSDD